MDVSSAIRERRGIRKYSDKKIEEEKLEKVLEAARLAPSAGNAQTWKFLVIQDEEKLGKIGELSGQTWISNAPALIVCLGLAPETMMPNGQPMDTINLSIAASFMLLEAEEEGLGTCWLAGYEEEPIKKLLGIPDKVQIVTMISLGYPDENPDARPRKNLDEIVSYESFN